METDALVERGSYTLRMCQSLSLLRFPPGTPVRLPHCETARYFIFFLFFEIMNEKDPINAIYFPERILAICGT